MWETKHIGVSTYWELRQAGVTVTIERRPSYCDRGNFIAKIISAGSLWIDYADMWPRYYFDLKVAKSEIEAFLMRREELKDSRRETK